MALSGLFGTAIGQDAQGESGGEGGDPSRLPVKDKDLTAPPGSPSVGDRYIVASVASGVWAGHEDDIAEWAGAAWTFETPIIGWITYVEDETEYYSWNGTAWVMESAGPHALGGADHTAATLAELSAKVSDATLVAAWDEAQIYYVGKHGNDSNDGKSIDAALLTIGAAITLAAAQTPSATNRFTIHVADAGVYTEDVTIPSYVSLDAPSAKIVGRVVLNDDASLVADTVAPPATGGSAGSCVSKTSGAGDAHVAVKTIVPSSTANRGVFCSSGAVFIQIDHINGPSFGIGLYTSSAGKVYGRVGRIYNPAAGSTGILTLSTSGVFVSAGEIEAPFVCDAAAGTSIYLVGGRLVGTRTVAAGATVMITEAGIVPAEVVDYVGDGTNDREIDLDDDYYRVEIRARGNYSRTADHLGLAWCLGDDYGIDANDGAASNLRSYVGSNGYSRFQGKMTGLDATKIKLGATGTTTDGTNVSGRDYRIVAYRH